MQDVRDAISRMSAQERAELRAFCQSRRNDPNEREAANATIAALDNYDHEARAREAERMDAEAKRIASLPPEARMLAQFDADRRLHEEERRRRRQVTPELLMSKLAESALILAAMVVCFVVTLAAGAEVGFFAFIALVGAISGGFTLYRRKRDRREPTP